TPRTNTHKNQSDAFYRNVYDHRNHQNVGHQNLQKMVGDKKRCALCVSHLNHYWVRHSPLRLCYRY
ncbi:hypothetical protein DOY81_002324, partial [Sarcophaga bullata]